MTQKQKPFTPYPTRPIRMSDETWNKLKESKLRSGLSWNLFLLQLTQDAKTRRTI